MPMKSEILSFGIDVGSTTLKIVGVVFFRIR